MIGTIGGGKAKPTGKIDIAVMQSLSRKGEVDTLVESYGHVVVDEWAEGVRRLAEEDFPKAKRITLVMDNLNTHTGASLYKAFPPEQARALLNRFEFVFTPTHGSWRNMAECEFAVLSRQCLSRRMPDPDFVKTEIDAWTRDRNQRTNKAAEWRFTTADARVKLARLYPKIGD